MRKWVWTGIALAAVIALAIGGGTALASRSVDKTPVAAEEHQGGGAFLDNATLTRVATALGITPAELTVQLQSGKTIAQVAKDRAVEAAKVIEAILAPHKDLVQLRLKYGEITQAQADLFLTNARQRAESLLDQTFNAPGAQGAPGTAPADHDAMIQACKDMMASGGMGNMMGNMMNGSGMMGPGMMGGGAMGPGMMGNGMMGGGMMGGSGTAPRTQGSFGSWGRGMMGGWW